MNDTPKLVAVDMDGTFLRSDNTFDEARFARIRARMREAGCVFCVASGNQYYQLRDFFPGYDEEFSFVAENGAFVKSGSELLYTANVPRATTDFVTDVCLGESGVQTILCGVVSAYCQRGSVSREFFDVMSVYYHRLAWVDDLHAVDDRMLKYALMVDEERTYEFYDILTRRLGGRMVPVTSGHGSIDLILPGVHKAAGLERLMDKLGIDASACVAFGDGGNDVEMLGLAGTGYAMANAPQEVKDAADAVCASNDEDGVLVELERIFSVG